MTDNTKPRPTFASVLTSYDPGLLRDAFDATNKAGSKKYDRTTLNRWLEGSVPKDGDFVQRLGDELGDDELHPAWERASQQRTRATATNRRASPESVEDQFEDLTYDERRQAYPNIRRLFLERFTDLRSRGSYVVELRDGPSPDFREIWVTLEWDGPLTANAQVIYATDHRQLGQAYDEERCLFRESLPIDDGVFTGLLDSWPDQVLTWNPLGIANPRMHRHVAAHDGNGLFQFDNDGAEDARVRLSLAYPYPSGRNVFFIRFGNYRFEGTEDRGVDLTLRLNATGAHSPEVFPFLPAGRRHEFASNFGRPNELHITLGSAGTILTDGDGAVLHWTERPPEPNGTSS